MENTVMKKISEQIPTPTYVFDTDLFEKRVSLVKSIFGSNVAICFSMKANPFLLKYLPDSFEKIEVCSPGELTICERIGTDMSKVIFSGVNKTKADIECAMEDQVGVFTAESYLHLDLINTAAVERNKTVPVLIRLTGGSQFGMDEQDVLRVIANRDDYAGIEIIGLHYFTGTQKRKAAFIEKELDQVMHFVAKVKEEYQFDFKHLEYGTGLDVDYFNSNAEQLECERLMAIADKISKVALQINLTVEMGRFFAAPCGYYFTQVMDVKTNDNVNYAIMDGGLNQLKYDGQIQGMQIPQIQHLKTTDGGRMEQPKPWTICGSLCTTADVLARNVEFTNLEMGDILVFQRTGAYSAMAGMTIFLSRKMPTIFAYSKETGLEILRKKIYTDQFNTPLENLEG